MRQIAGFGVAIAVAVAAMRVVGGGSGATQATPARVVSGEKTHHRTPPAAPGASAYHGGCSAFDREDDAADKDPKTAYPKDANRGAAKAVIDNFFAPQAAKADLTQLQRVHYAVALAPDPRHTNLSLVFDREMVSVQQAAQDDGYTYNSSWFPWSTESRVYSKVEDQQRYDDQTDQREACPGIMLFRKSIQDVRPEDGAANPPDVYAEALIVLIVGEQPTGGLNEDQWANAMAWLHNNASPEEVMPPPPGATRVVAPAPVARRLSVLGPYSSGTLASLARALPRGDGGFPSLTTPIRILTGSIRGCSSTRWFQQRVAETRAGATTFGSFQENDELQIYRMLNYLRYQGADTRNVAILSEDETAYAGAPPPLIVAKRRRGSPPPASAEELLNEERPTLSPCDFPYALANRPVRFYYPRDISALRTAYEKQSVFSTGSAGRSLHPILQDTVASESDASTPSDTIPSYDGATGPVAQEAILYGIVSHLRAHHAQYILLRCTNPLDFFFLTRFFHRAFPEARVVTVGSDLLFRREIDTTEFRGVLSLSSYPLLPRDQHWSALTQRKEDTVPPAHAHRVPESHGEGSYLAGRYLFDSTEHWAASSDRQQPLLLPFKEGIPDFADPFWMHTPERELKTVQAPTWLSVVGRDGYWPLAVLSDASTPNACLDQEPAEDDPRRKSECLPLGFAHAAPPTTMVRVSGIPGGRNTDPIHYDRTRDGARFGPGILLTAPLVWWALLFCGVLLLGYQNAVILRGSRHTALGLCAPFRRLPTPSQNVILGLNCALALLLFAALYTIYCIPSGGIVSGGSSLDGWKLLLAAVLGVPLVVCLFARFQQTAGWTLCCACALAGFAAWEVIVKTFIPSTVIPSIVIPSIVIPSTVIPPSAAGPAASPNAIPLFYRMGHITSATSPLVPVLLLLAGFYLWSWQSLAGNGLLCVGRPLLPFLVAKPERKPEPNRWIARWNALYSLTRTLWDKFLGIHGDTPPNAATPRLDRAYYRISHESAWKIIRVASPLSFPFAVVVLPASIATAAALYLRYNGPPLLGLESVAYAWGINLVLLLAFLLTIAEAARLYLTWVELRHLLTALNRLRLRRTFAKLRAVDGNSLWSVSGSVQRVQLHFFSQQLDAAVRLRAMTDGSNAALNDAVVYGQKFAENCARKTRTGPLWEKSVNKKDAEPRILIREVFNDAVANVLSQLIPYWATEEDSLSLEDSACGSEEAERHVFDMDLSDNPAVRTAEEFVCFHYIAFIQNILARMRTMTLSMLSLFVPICFAISFYPFVPRTGISMWMMVNLLLIGTSVIYVYAGMERDETLSYITNSKPGRLGAEFYLKTAGFLAGPVIGLLTTQFPAISDTVLSFLQPGLDALK
jgi:hypothetical protein